MNMLEGGRRCKFVFTVHLHGAGRRVGDIFLPVVPVALHELGTPKTLCGRSGLNHHRAPIHGSFW